MMDRGLMSHTGRRTEAVRVRTEGVAGEYPSIFTRRCTIGLEGCKNILNTFRRGLRDVQKTYTRLIISWHVLSVVCNVGKLVARFQLRYLTLSSGSKV